jgi:hypothetical protein
LFPAKAGQNLRFLQYAEKMDFMFLSDSKKDFTKKLSLQLEKKIQHCRQQRTMAMPLILVNLEIEIFRLNLETERKQNEQKPVQPQFAAVIGKAKNRRAHGKDNKNLLCKLQ